MILYLKLLLFSVSLKILDFKLNCFIWIVSNLLQAPVFKLYYILTFNLQPLQPRLLFRWLLLLLLLLVRHKSNKDQSQGPVQNCHDGCLVLKNDNVYAACARGKWQISHHKFILTAPQIKETIPRTSNLAWIVIRRLCQPFPKRTHLKYKLDRQISAHHQLLCCLFHDGNVKQSNKQCISSTISCLLQVNFNQKLLEMLTTGAAQDSVNFTNENLDSKG